MMKGQLAGLMKQAQQMQENLKKAQDEIAAMEIEGQAGAGMVKVTMTGRHDVKRVSIDPSLMGDDKDMLEDLIAAAVNDAVRRVETLTQEKMGGLTSGFGLPPVDQGLQRRPQALAVDRAQLPAPVQEAEHAEQAPVAARGHQGGDDQQDPRQLSRPPADHAGDGIQQHQPKQGLSPGEPHQQGAAHAPVRTQGSAEKR